MKGVNETVERIVKAIRRHIPDTRITLFGSRARGDALKESDIDLLCYTPQEFEERRREISVVSEALKYGVKL